MGYLAKLLKPTLDPNNFEESFANWEYELTRFERDSSTTLPDQVKIAILLNETTGPLQQHLQLLAGTNQTYAAIRTTITEYYRETTAFNRMQASQAPSSAVGTNYSGGAAPMDIGSKGKSKGHKGTGYNRGKGYGYKGKAGKGHRKGAKGVHKRRAKVRPLAEHKEQEKVKDGSNHNTKHNRPTKEKEKASRRVFSEE